MTRRCPCCDREAQTTGSYWWCPSTSRRLVLAEDGRLVLAAGQAVSS